MFVWSQTWKDYKWMTKGWGSGVLFGKWRAKIGKRWFGHSIMEVIRVGSLKVTTEPMNKLHYLEVKWITMKLSKGGNGKSWMDHNAEEIASR